MIVLHDPSLTSSILRPDIRTLVAQRFTEVGEFNAIVVEPGDSVDALEQEVGIPILHNLFDDVPFSDPDFTPCFEVLEEHAGCYEMVFIMGDGDGGTGIFVPKQESIDPDLLAMCKSYAVPAPDLAEA